MVVKQYVDTKKKHVGWQMIEEPAGVQVYVHYKENCETLDAAVSLKMRKQTEDYASIKKFQFYRD